MSDVPSFPIVPTSEVEQILLNNIDRKHSEVLASERQRNSLYLELVDLYAHIFRDGGHAVDRFNKMPDEQCQGSVTKARFARAVAAISEDRVSLEQAARRYNCMRRLAPLQYSRLYRENCESGRSMNELLDDLSLGRRKLSTL